MMNLVTQRGALPMITWVPQGPGGPIQPQFALRTIISGEHDAYIHAFARSAAEWGKPFLLRPMHEMNGDWEAWSPGLNGNTTSEYIEAWRHLHRIFDSEGATNVRWVWSPNTYVERTDIRFEDVYPGDAFVDWVGLDGYNHGTSVDWSSWHSFTEEFSSSYHALAHMTSKPMLIAETASCEQGGGKPEWIRSALLREIPTSFSRIRAVIWFNQNKECDWRIDSSRSTLDAVRAVSASGLYGGTLRLH